MPTVENFLAVQILVLSFSYSWPLCPIQDLGLTLLIFNKTLNSEEPSMDGCGVRRMEVELFYMEEHRSILQLHNCLSLDGQSFLQTSAASAGEHGLGR